MNKHLKTILIIIGLGILCLFIFVFFILKTNLWLFMSPQIQSEVVRFKMGEKMSQGSNLQNEDVYLFLQSEDFDLTKAIDAVSDQTIPTSQRVFALKSIKVWVKEFDQSSQEQVKEAFKDLVLNESNPEVLRLEALRALEELKSSNLDDLVKIIEGEDSSPDLRWTLLSLISQDNPDWRIFLQALKNDPDDTVRFKSAQAIWESAPEEIVPELLDIALNENNRPSSRDYALIALRHLSQRFEINNRSLINSLIGLLDDEQYRVRVSASETLFALTGKDWPVKPGKEEELFIE